MADDLPQVEPVKVYENTYIMQPPETARFNRSEAEKVMKEVLEEKLQVVNERDTKGRLSWSYDPEDAGDIIREVVQDCQAKLIQVLKDRHNGAPPLYKFVFQCQIGENNGQMIRSASRCLWDKEIDNSATASWTNGRVWAVATCFALYFG